MRDAGVRSARAFAPGHVTGVFAPAQTARDPRARGSVGAGLVLELGVHALAEWRPGAPRSVRVTHDQAGSLPISEEVARRLVGRLRGDLRVRLRHELPVGQGFGSSAAGSLATGLAVARVLRLPRRRAINVAHLADLFGGGGLGGVSAILGGGLELRLRPGIPPFGRVDHRPYPGAVWVGVVGRPLRSPRVLADPRRLARFRSAAAGWEELARAPEPGRFWEWSERFTDRVGMVDPRLQRILRGLRRRGSRAAQAMFGRAFFAELPAGARRAETLRWLGGRGIRAVEIRTDRRGARIESLGPPSRAA